MHYSGSKEAFVSLLEYSEKKLERSDVIVCFQKCQSSNTNYKKAIRNFLFLGFQPLAPGHECPECIMAMGYSVMFTS